MTIEQIEKLIRDTPLPWNPKQTPQWHLDIWRASLIYDLKKLAKTVK